MTVDTVAALSWGYGIWLSWPYVRLSSIQIYPGIGFSMDVCVDGAAVTDGLIVIYGAVRIGFVLCCYIFTLSIHLHVCIVNIIQT